MIKRMLTDLVSKLLASGEVTNSLKTGCMTLIDKNLLS